MSNMPKLDNDRLMQMARVASAQSQHKGVPARIKEFFTIHPMLTASVAPALAVVIYVGVVLQPTPLQTEVNSETVEDILFEMEMMDMEDFL